MFNRICVNQQYISTTQITLKVQYVGTLALTFFFIFHSQLSTEGDEITIEIMFTNDSMLTR